MKYRIYQLACVWCGAAIETNRPQTKYCSCDCINEAHRLWLREWQRRRKNPAAFERARAREAEAAQLTWPRINNQFGTTFSYLEAS